jgi:hypothetical protein
MYSSQILSHCHYTVQVSCGRAKFQQRKNSHFVGQAQIGKERRQQEAAKRRREERAKAIKEDFVRQLQEKTRQVIFWHVDSKPFGKCWCYQ